MAEDREIWRKILQGDERVFEEFYLDAAPRLRAFLRQMTGDSQAAEDLAQETFTRFWMRPNGYDPERGPLRAFLFGMARHRALEWLRARRMDGEEPGEIAQNCRLESSCSVEELFERLPEEQRTLLWLREVEGQSYAELAALLDIPVGTVRSRLFTAREALRKLWHGDRRQA